MKKKKKITKICQKGLQYFHYCKYKKAKLNPNEEWNENM